MPSVRIPKVAGFLRGANFVAALLVAAVYIASIWCFAVWCPRGGQSGVRVWVGHGVLQISHWDPLHWNFRFLARETWDAGFRKGPVHMVWWGVPRVAGRTTWTLPLWAVLAGSGVLHLALGPLVRLYPSGHCRHCGYDLRGASTLACPECGAKATGVRPVS